jgi:hypothetical protein
MSSASVSADAGLILGSLASIYIQQWIYAENDIDD